MRVTFTVPGTPVSWQRLRGSGRHRFVAPDQRAAKDAIAWRARGAGVRAAPVGVPVRVDVLAFYPRPARRPQHVDREAWSMGQLVRRPTQNRDDVDRLLSLVFDALVGVAYVDDGQVCPASVDKYWCAAGTSPRTEITVEWESP